jgi:hypothetical protein
VIRASAKESDEVPADLLLLDAGVLQSCVCILNRLTAVLLLLLLLLVLVRLLRSGIWLRRVTRCRQILSWTQECCGL